MYFIVVPLAFKLVHRYEKCKIGMFNLYYREHGIIIL